MIEKIVGVVGQRKYKGTLECKANEVPAYVAKIESGDLVSIGKGFNRNQAIRNAERGLRQWKDQ